MRNYILLIAFSLLMAVSATADPSDYPHKKVLLVYDERLYEGEVTDLPNAVHFVIGHFNTEVTQLKEAGYQKGMMDDYDAVVYVKISEDSIGKDFLKDLIEFDGIVCWMGQSFETLYERYPYMGMKINDYKNDYGLLEFRGETYPRDFPEAAIIQLDDEWKAEVYAKNGDGDKTPLIMHRDDFWLVSDVPLYGTEGLVFAEVMHDIMKEDHPPTSTAYIRLEDVNPYYDPGILIELSDYLQGREPPIPYSVGVIPQYNDPEAGIKYFLHDEVGATEAIRYMQANGGYIILHGWKHQMSEHEKTGEGWELWDGENDKPLDYDGVDTLSDIIETSLNEVLSTGIYPLAWESPHYACSQAGYEATARHFDMAIEQLQLSDLTCESTITAPYLIYSDMYGRTVVPENCGYIYGDYTEAAYATIERAKAIKKIVRDPAALVFFHPAIGLEYVEIIVDGFEAEGYRFASPKEIPSTVTAATTSYRNGPGPLSIDAGGDYIRSYYLDKDYQIRDEKFSDAPIEGEYNAESQGVPGELFVFERWIDAETRRW